MRLAPGLVAFSLVNILARAFYALGDTNTPMRISIFCLAAKVVPGTRDSSRRNVGGSIAPEPFGPSKLHLLFQRFSMVGATSLKQCNPILSRFGQCASSLSIRQGVRPLRSANRLWKPACLCVRHCERSY